MNHRKRIIPYFFVLLSLLFVPLNEASAQGAVTLSVTPPFFQLTVTPGETWTSSIKVVNVNDFTLNAYATVVDFQSVGEQGRGKFLPILNDGQRDATLAGWIDVTSAPISVEPGQSTKVPFAITVPEDAPPGGHYAAILIGNQPLQNETDGSQISVSTLISSLIFVRVAGDVDERGDIREFVSEKTFYQEPEVPLSLRFENEGNVHLLPQGDIVIYNMWGKERGKININHKTEYGNVLPKSTRKYDYEWFGSPDSFEVGRYTAIATLTYGTEVKQNVSRKTSFWVIPIVPVSLILGTFLLIVFLVTWFIRLYIRRALGGTTIQSGAPRAAKRKALTKPIVDGVMDLRAVGGSAPEGEKMAMSSFMARYRYFFYFIVFAIIAGVLIFTYFDKVLVSDHSFEIQEVSPVDSKDTE
jgi:hypothetical protein